MKRTRFSNSIPDAINSSITKDFTQVPNELLRNPDITFKAKGLLCLLLSNKSGWKSYLNAISQMTKEGMDSIRSSIAELENHRYLLRVQYRDSKTKIRRGSFWAYSDIPGNFNLQETLENLEKQGLEIFLNKSENPYMGNPDMGNPDMGNPDMGNPDMGNPTLKILIEKRLNEKRLKDSSSTEAADKKKIKSSQFELFWEKYPRHENKGKAKTAWEKICNRPLNKRPTFHQIIKALHFQKKSEQWQDPQFIPHPTTWLNQQRWLDDPDQMKTPKQKPKSRVTIGTGWSGRYDDMP